MSIELNQDKQYRKQQNYILKTIIHNKTKDFKAHRKVNEKLRTINRSLNNDMYKTLQETTK